MIERDLFRSVMARSAHPTYIVAVRSSDTISGFTASAVASVSDTPPTLLVCVNRATSVAPLLSVNSAISFNLLSGQQAYLAQAFSRREDRVFDSDIWDIDSASAPAVRDAVFCARGRIHSVLDGGTHNIVIAQIHSVVNMKSRDVLVHSHRMFHAFLPTDDAHLEPSSIAHPPNYKS